MRIRGAIIGWAMAATVLSVTPAYATEATPEAESPVVEAARPDAVPAPAPQPSLRLEGVALNPRPAGFVHKLDAPALEARPDGPRFDFAQGPAPAAPLKLSPALSASRTGWAFSGRAGPLRWLAPLDGEGETILRLGGRVKDQPSTPGLGRFNLSIHYTFE